MVADPISGRVALLESKSEAVLLGEATVSRGILNQVQDDEMGLQIEEPDVLAAIEERFVALEETTAEDLNEEEVLSESAVEESEGSLMAGLVTDEAELEELLGESDSSVIGKAAYRLWKIVDEVVFMAKTRFLAAVEFLSDVRFGGRVTFADKDLAGLAVIGRFLP